MIAVDPIPADPIAVVSRCFVAYERGDVEGAVSEMSPDIEWVEPATFLVGGVRRGPAEVAAYFRAARALWAYIATGWTPHLVGSRVVVVVNVDGRLRDGRAVRARVADVFTVTGGRIVGMTAFADPADAFAAAGATALPVD